MSATTRENVLKVYDRESSPSELLEDLVAVDEPLDIYVDKKLIGTFWITPGMEVELAIGHLLTSGIIDSLSEIADITHRASEIVVSLNTNRTPRLAASETQKMPATSTESDPFGPDLSDGTRMPRIASDIHIDRATVTRMVEELNRRSETFRKTGGTHSAMICRTDGGVLVHSEDVGRHNAVDKVIGSLARQGQSFSECVLVSSGRQSYEMVSKAARVGMPIVISQASPLRSGIEIAEKVGITLVCFARDRRFNVYTHHSRVLV